ncbi:glycosyltransferase family 4 protein [Paenibacillus sp. MER TA 81-3]|uniref:glycosyltransferase family 4 protein n=1 Tax=Paenibacillus sp. MER TA 81-3 TaxID=2939573 RepID=UPI00204040D8|nr:glycosyltransferase family 4 protein [Paenibacillus sp. MER TA 81-3]MCM3338763.1 glycosyltransferase family 4 protein [Paenibacillus sp. MER TA 81-3]
MKKILIISQNYYPEIGSAANRIKNMYVELTKRGYEVTILTSNPSYPNRNIYKDPQFWEQESLEKDVIRIHTKARKYSHSIFNRLLLYLEMTLKFILSIRKIDGKYDYVIATTPAIFIGVAGLVAKRKFKVPLILDIRDLWPDSLIGVGVFAFKPFIKIASLLETKLYHDADHILINSEKFKPHIISKGINADKISFLPNSLTESELFYQSSSLAQNKKELTVIYTGNIGLAQDLNLLIDVAVKMIDKSGINFKIIGYGFRNKELRELISKKQLKNVQFIKPKSKTETIKAIDEADIAFLSLTNHEVFNTVLPGKIMDYMCMRKPIIGAISGYAAEIVEKAQCGYVSRERKVDEICSYILKLADNNELRSLLGENGYKYAFENLRWKTNIPVLTEIMEKEYVEECMHVRMEPLHK